MTQVVRRNATTTGDTQMIGNIFKLQLGLNYGFEAVPR